MNYTIEARPTIYRGVRMRSRLEARFAETLDNAACEWQYEPQCFANSSGQYLPDFYVAEPAPPKCRPRVPPVICGYYEVKPTIDYAGDFIRSKRMEIIRSSEPDALAMVVWPTKEPDLSPWVGWGRFWLYEWFSVCSGLATGEQASVWNHLFDTGWLGELGDLGPLVRGAEELADLLAVLGIDPYPDGVAVNELGECLCVALTEKLQDKGSALVWDAVQITKERERDVRLSGAA